VKIYVAAVEVLRQKEKDDVKTGTKTGAFLNLTPSWRIMYFFAGFFVISVGFELNSGYCCGVV
jgi:hypothetical protein